MKTIKNKCSILLMILSAFILFSACSKKDGGEAPNPTGGSWKLGAYTYTTGTSNSGISNGIAVIVVSTTGNGGNYGAYSGSALTLSINALGSGKYTITDDSLLPQNPTAKYMSVTCTMGTAVSTGFVGYFSTANTGATADVTVDNNGKYHVTISNAATLVKLPGTDIPGSASSYGLTVNYVF